MKTDTIFALSSAAGQAGVSVIRASGALVLAIFKQLTGKENPQERYLQSSHPSL